MDEECNEVQNEKADVDHLRKTDTFKKRGKSSTAMQSLYKDFAFHVFHVGV